MTSVRGMAIKISEMLPSELKYLNIEECLTIYKFIPQKESKIRVINYNQALTLISQNYTAANSVPVMSFQLHDKFSVKVQLFFYECLGIGFIAYKG